MPISRGGKAHKWRSLPRCDFHSWFTNWQTLKIPEQKRKGGAPYKTPQDSPNCPPQFLPTPPETPEFLSVFFPDEVLTGVPGVCFYADVLLPELGNVIRG